jgi:hypothetical protein
MAELAELEAGASEPGVLCIGSDQLRRSVGAVWRSVAAGAVIRVSDLRSGEVLGYITRHPPAELSEHEHLLPPAGEAADALGPDRERLPGTWTVRLDHQDGHQDGQEDDPAPEAA